MEELHASNSFSYPGIMLDIFFDLELVLWSYHSAAAILLITLLVLLLSIQHFDMYSIWILLLSLSESLETTFPWDLLIE